MSDSDSNSLSERFVACVCEVDLPHVWQNFFRETGAMPTFDGDGRRFPQFYARRKAALEQRQSLPAKPRPDAWHGTKDGGGEAQLMDSAAFLASPPPSS